MAGMEPQTDAALASAIRELAAVQRGRRRFWLGAAALLLLLVALSALLGGDQAARGPHLARVDITGMIMPGWETNADWIGDALHDAFAAADAEAVVLYFNSPGGSVVQSTRIYNEVLRLRAEHPDMPVYAVADDYCVSGAYYIAVAADRIYANEASLIGSIGVVAGSFGFVDAMRELGIERRVIAAPADGQKTMLDPFLRQSEEEVRQLQEIVDEIHAQFRAVVLQERGARLTAPDETLFDGRAWSGRQAHALGLVDAFGDTGDLARMLGVAEVVNYTYERPWFDGLAGQLELRLLQRLGLATRPALRF